MELNRRNFLKTAGATVAATAVAGMASAALADQPPAGEGAPEGGPVAGPGMDNPQDSGIVIESWEIPPAEVTEFAQEIECDVVVAGHGFAGITCTRELAEQGVKVVLIEKQDEDRWSAVGNEFASLNSDVLQERGVPHIDPVEFYQNFMKITGNMPNPELIMKFAQNSGEATNWYLSPLSAEDLDTMSTAFFPPTEHQMDELGGIKFWPSVCSFYGGCSQTQICTMNREIAIENGAEVLFGTEAYYIIMNDGAVAGLVAKQGDDYIKFTCKAVVCCCGGMGGNPQMMADFMPDMYQALVEGESLGAMMSNDDGRGVQMAYWAGAHRETTPVAGMNMKGLSVPGKMNCLPQAVWIDENGKRFCNEYYPTSEQRGLQTVYMTRKTKFAVVDNNFDEYRQYTLPQHAGFSASEENIAALRQSMDEAYAKFNGTYEEPEGEQQGGFGGPMTSVTWIADDTLEGLAGQLGLEGEILDTFLQQMADYNQYCDEGADQQFGRDAKVLFPVKEAPFYACTFDPVLGETMVTMGGILTNGQQNAVDKNYEPIPGLYVSGNDCGRRFSYEYVTPIPGVSLGFAITLGRECGREVAKFLSA